MAHFGHSDANPTSMTFYTHVTVLPLVTHNGPVLNYAVYERSVIGAVF